MRQEDPIDTTEHFHETEPDLLERIRELERENALLAAQLEPSKRLQEGLRRSDDTFRGAAKNAAIGMALIMRDGTFVDCNPAYCELVGYSLEDLRGMRFSDLVHPDDRAANLKLNEQLAAGEIPSFVVRNRYVRKDGQVVWVRKSVSRISDEDGKPRWFLALVEDITEQKKAEQALYDSEHRFRAMADGTPVIIWVHDATGRIEFINQAYCDFFGVTVEQVRSDGWEVLVHPDDYAGYVDEFLRCMQARQTYRAQARVRAAGGDWRWVLSQGQPRWSENGEFLGMAGSSLDITDRIELEAQLRQSERIYRAIGESIPFGVWITDLDGRVTYASQSLLDLLGMTQERFSGYGWGDALDPEDAQRIAAAWQQHVRNPGDRVWNMEHRFHGKDGQYHWVLGCGVPVRNEQGEISAWAGINLDISGLKKTEEQLRVSEERFRVALAGSPIVVFMQDRDLRYTWVYNPGLGRSADEIIGKTDEDLVTPQYAAELTALKRSVLESGIGKRQELEMAGPDGVLRTFDTTVEPLLDEHGAITGLTVASMDVTEAKRRDHELQELALRSELRRHLLDAREQERLRLARDMHAGPIQVLAALNMTMDLSRRTLDDPAARQEMAEFRQGVRDAMQASREMVGDLLSSLPQRVGLTRAIQVQTDSFQAENPGLEITCQVVSDRNKVPEYAELALFQILQEALDNLAKHARATKASVTFSLSGEGAVLEVRDNGTGIDKLEDPLDLAKQGRYGLAGMHERMDAVQGELQIISHPGKGTTVIAKVPAERPEAPTARRRPKSTKARTK